MSNPTITRLNKTQFWYKNWYSSNNYSNVLKKVSTFESLLSFYVNYGLRFQKPYLCSKFWYKTRSRKPLLNQDSYYRKFYYAHQTLTIEHSYFIRLKTPEYFPLRLYVLRYNNWICATLQWFKPIKSTRNLKTNKTNNFITQNSTVLTLNRPTQKPNRFKILINFLRLTVKKNLKLTKYFF